MNEVAKCGLCGEPMPKGEYMFKYHGYSGPCPRPPVKTPEPDTTTLANSLLDAAARQASTIAEQRAEINKLQAEIEVWKSGLKSWKQMAEFQYALRQYPDDLDLGEGALDAYMRGWNYDYAKKRKLP